MLRATLHKAQVVANAATAMASRPAWFILLTSISVGVGTAQEFTVRGEGTASCGAWLHEHLQKSEQARAQDAWLFGFLTASSLYRRSAADFTKGVDIPSIAAWIEKHCRMNPFDHPSR